MTVRLRFFAALREQLGEGEERRVPAGTTAGALWKTIVAARPQLARMPVRVAVNQRYVAMSEPVEAGDEVAFFPPVSGGA